MGTSPPQSSPITSKALPSPRPNSLATHHYPQSGREGEVGEGRPHSPTTFSKRFLGREDVGEGAGELSQTGKLQQGNLGSYPAPAGRMQPAGPQQYFQVNEGTGRSPTQARSPASLGLSPRPHSQTSQWQGWEQASFYQGAPWSHGELPFPYDPLPVPYADVYAQRHQSGLHDLTRSRDPLPYGTDPARGRDPLYRAAHYADRDHLTWPMYASQGAAYGSPWGHPVAPPPTLATPNPAFAGFPLGVTSMGLCLGRVAAPGPSL